MTGIALGWIARTSSSLRCQSGRDVADVVISDLNCDLSRKYWLGHRAPRPW